jgi:hypothetical protein
MYVTDAQLEMTLSELMDHLMCSKATAWRAQCCCYHCPGCNGNTRSRHANGDKQASLLPLGGC